MVVRHGGIRINLANSGDGLSDVGHLTILACQLQVSPCSEGGYRSILVGHHILGSRLQRRVAMCQIVVAVVDNLIIKIHTVVLIRDVCREV